MGDQLSFVDPDFLEYTKQLGDSIGPLRTTGLDG
jgi:hypothetical protein